MIEDIIKQVLREKSWNSTYLFNLIRKETPQLIEAAIDTHKWVINLTVDPEIEEKAKQFFPQNTDQVLSEMIYAVLSHEKGHWEYCPFDIEYFETIYSAISQAVDEQGVGQDKLKQYVPRIANEFMDIIVNTNMALGDKEKKKCHDGIYNFYKKAVDTNGGVSDEFAVFVGIQQEIYFDKKDLINNSNLEQVIQKGKEIFIGNHNQPKSILAEIKKDLKKWHQKAYQYAKLILPYIDLNEDGPAGGNQFTKDMEEDEEFRKEVIAQGKKAGHDQPYAEKFEVLDVNYESKAEQIVIDFLKNKGESSKLPVAWLQKKKLEDGEALNLGDIDWPATMIMPAKEESKEQMEIFKKQLPIEVEENCVQSTGSLPDLALIVDSSGSMYWTEGGAYDILLRAAYSIFKFLEKTGKGQYINYAALNFGTEGRTEFSGWHDYYNLKKIKETLFNYQHANETHLDTSSLDQLIRTAKDRFLAVMISDGELGNGDQAASKIKKVIDEGNDFVLIQIGGMTDFAKTVKGYGAEVYVIKDAKDLVGLTLKKASDNWK